MATFSDLPLEVLLYILDCADWTELLRLTETCRLFHTLVDQSSALQYKIELAVHGVEDSTTNPGLPNSRRLKHLLDLQSSWRNITFSRISEVSLPGSWDGWTYELQKGIFSRSLLNLNVEPTSTGGSQITMVNLRTANHWQCDMDVEVQDFSFDPDQNLVVLFEWMGLDPDYAITRIHLRRLDTLKPHPLAAQPIIPYDLRWTCAPRGWTIHSIQLAGDLLGVLFDPRSLAESDRIVIWNWKTGDVVAELPASRLIGLDSFVLLTDRILVVPDAREPSINVFVLREPGKEPLRVKCFALPRLKIDRRMERIIIRSDPVASAMLSSPEPPADGDAEVRANLGPGPAYRVTRNGRLLCFVINIWKFDADVVSTLHLFTPMETFLLTPGEEWDAQYTTNYIPWKNWGPSKTRIIAEPTLARNPFVTFIHGHRFVMASDVVDSGQGFIGNLGQYIYVYDFNQTTIRRDLQNNADVQDIELKPSVLYRDDFFGTQDVVTSLPYRRCHRRLDNHYEALMMDGENIIALDQRGETGTLDVLCIYQIGSPPTS